MAIDLNPTIFGKPLFPSSEKLKEYGSTIASAFTPAAGTSPATMAGVSIPPAGASLSQLQFKGPLLGTGSMFGLRGGPQPATQSTQPSFDYGTYAATRGLPAFDVTKTQTPSATQNQINTAALTGQTGPLSFATPTQQPFATAQPIQPRIDTAVRAGTISATPLQLENLNARTTAFEGRTPQKQQELLAQVRQNAANLAAQQTQTMKQFADNTGGSRFKTVAAPQGRFGQPLVAQFPRSTEAMARAERAVSPTLPMTALSQSRTPSPFVEERRSPFGSIFGFSS